LSYRGNIFIYKLFWTFLRL